MHFSSAKLGGVLIIAFFFLGVSRLVAKDGLEILREVESQMGAHSFSVTCEWSDGAINKVVQKKASNGSFEVRNEMVSGVEALRTTNIFITNQEGVWHVLSDKALKIDSLIRFNTNSVFYGMLEKRVDLSVPADYELDVGRFNAKDVFVVVQRPRVVANEGKRASAVAVENKFFVGKEDYFLYGFSQKTLDGGLATMTVTESNVRQEIADAFFVLPAGLATKTLGKMSEYAHELEKEVDRAIQAPELRMAYQKTNQRRVHFTWIFLALPTLLGVGWAVKSVLNKRKVP